MITIQETFKELDIKPETYNGYKIKFSSKDGWFNIYDEFNELEDYGFLSKEAAKEFIDSLISYDIFDNDEVLDEDDIDNSTDDDVDYDDVDKLTILDEDGDYKHTYIFVPVVNISESTLNKMDIEGIYTTVNNKQDVYEELVHYINSYEYKHNLKALGDMFKDVAKTVGDIVFDYNGYDYFIDFDEETGRLYFC